MRRESRHHTSRIVDHTEHPLAHVIVMVVVVFVVIVVVVVVMAVAVAVAMAADVRTLASSTADWFAHSTKTAALTLNFPFPTDAK